MARRLVLVLLVLAAASAVRAASTGDQLRLALADLDPHLTTGRLADRAVRLVDLAAHDGSAGAPPATAATWRQLLHELRLASDTPPAWPTAAEVRDLARRAPDPLPLAVLDLAYETLRPDALASGGLVPAGDRLVATIAPTDLLVRRRAVAVAALTTTVPAGGAARVVVPSRLLITDEPVTIAADLADDAGWRTLTPDRPVTVRYATPGPRTLRLRLTAPDGTVRHAAATLEVVLRDAPPPTEIWSLTASIPHDGAAATGEAFIYLADDHAELSDPVVVVEGFDLDNSLGWPELYDLLNQENLLEDLRAAGRDAVILNFTEATDPIQRNAFLLVELLATLDAQLPVGTTYPLIGASMGGLVTRYALTWLESQGTGHQCELFVSFDAPHAGADIPLGLQTWLDFFQDESEAAAYNLSRLNTTAARQMLLYHYTALAGSTAAPSPQRAAFLADLAALGDWPAQPRLVSVANGSSLGANQGFAPGAQVILWEYGSLLVDIVGNVWAVPDQNSGVIFHGLIDLIWPLPDTERTVTVAGAQPWDGAPGGFRATFADLDAETVPYGDLHALHDNHAFIPTVSALSLAGAAPFMDLQAEPDLLGLTPFDVIYLPAENQEHVAVTAESRVWFLDEILDAVSGVDSEVASPAPVLRLRGATPNPFNPRTEIAFALPHAGPARLWITDVRGRRVRTVVNADLPAGEHAAIWDGRDESGRAVATGVYLAVIEHAGSRVARRLTLVR